MSEKNKMNNKDVSSWRQRPATDGAALPGKKSGKPTWPPSICHLKDNLYSRTSPVKHFFN